MNEESEKLVTVLWVTGVNKVGTDRKILIFFEKPTLQELPINEAFKNMYSGDGWTPPGVPSGDDYDLIALSEVRVSMIFTRDATKLEASIATRFPDAYRICY